MRDSVKALIIVLTVFSLFNLGYAVYIVDIVGSWRLEWWIDRRFPFNLIPLWLFAFVSAACFVFCIFLLWSNLPKGFKLRCDPINTLLLGYIIELFGWIIFAVYLIHKYYVGDFWVVRILENIFTGKNILELPTYDIDVFPTLGDTVIISYVLSFILLYIASWRALKKSFNLKNHR